MPTIAYAYHADTCAGSSACSAMPNSEPTTAPTKSVGVKIPPIAPEPAVAAVAISLRTSTATSACQVHGACRIALTTL